MNAALAAEGLQATWLRVKGPKQPWALSAGGVRVEEERRVEEDVDAAAAVAGQPGAAPRPCAPSAWPASASAAGEGACRRRTSRWKRR